MIPAVGAWIRTLLALVLLGNVVDWILPDSSLRRYASLVVGLVLLAAMVAPVWSFMHRSSALEPGGSWFSSASTGGLSRTVASQEVQEVSGVLDALPGVDSVQVQDRRGQVAVVLRVGARASVASLRQAAVSAAEEVMSVPGSRIHVTVIEGGGKL